MANPGPQRGRPPIAPGGKPPSAASPLPVEWQPDSGPVVTRRPGTPRCRNFTSERRTTKGSQNARHRPAETSGNTLKRPFLIAKNVVPAELQPNPSWTLLAGPLLRAAPSPGGRGALSRRMAGLPPRGDAAHVGVGRRSQGGVGDRRPAEVCHTF